MDKKCHTCKWWVESELSCINENNDVFMTGPGGSCSQWSAFLEEDKPVNSWFMERFMKVN